MDKLYGVVSRVTYYNEENGFGVIRIRLDYNDHSIAQFKSKLFSNILTVTANFDRKPIVDEEYDFYGEFVNTNYGIQFKASNFNRRNEKSLEGVVAYLSSDFFPEIGKITATRVYEALGPDCLDLIIQNKNNLDKVERITARQKEIIYENLIKNKLNEETILELLSLGITMHMSLKIYKKLGAKTMDIIKQNPYELMNLIEGFGFLRADKIALKMGIDKQSPVRIQAVILYYLKQITFSNGNTYLEQSYLFSRLTEVLNTEEDVLTWDIYIDNLEELKENNKIIVDSENHIYDKSIFKSEEILAKKVYEFLSNEQGNEYDEKKIHTVFNQVKEEANINYSPKQEEAILTALKESFIIITGGPGTGKSTIVKAIINCLVLLNDNELYKEKIALLAPTGRAAKRLKEVTNHNAMTIHKCLGYEGHGVFKYGPDAPIDAKVVIVDESSMVDIMLAARLFSALLKNTKVILVGDYDQLPSVGPGQVLLDLISSKEVTTIRLDTIHRQAEDSSIIKLAHSINNGILPEDLLVKQHDRNFISMSDQNILSNIITIVKQGINSGMDLVKDIQVLVPLYKGDLGINSINMALQAELNPLVDEQEISHLGRKFRPNDKVIQLVNRTEKQVMNGDIGFILNLHYENNKYQGLEVMYDFGPVYYELDELEDISHAYAISIHKSQGSEFDLVIIPFTFKYYIMLKRKLIYTAITRAKKYLIMLGNVEALRRGIVGIEEQRNSKLNQKIQDHFLGVEKSSEEFEKSSLEEISPYDFL